MTEKPLTLPKASKRARTYSTSKLIHWFIIKSRNIQVTIHAKPIAQGDAKSRKK